MLVPMLATLACLPLAGCAQKSASTGSEATAKSEEAAAVPAPPERTSETQPSSDVAQSHGTRTPRTHCGPTEATVFSCTLEDSRRVVSLCLSRAGKPDARARFASGSIGAPDVLIPVQGENSAERFERTPLALAGGTGGYAYSFQHAGEVQILYSVSGEDGLERQGLMVADTDLSTAVSDHACASGTILESDEVDVLKQVRRWPAQPRLARNGLPPVDP